MTARVGEMINGWDLCTCNWAWDGGVPTIARDVADGECLVLVLQQGGRYDNRPAGGDVSLVVVDREGNEVGDTCTLQLPRWSPQMVMGAAMGAMAVKGHALPAGGLLEAVQRLFSLCGWDALPSAQANTTTGSDR